MKIFVDNCVSPVIVDAIKVLAEVQQHEIVHLRDKFPDDTPDVDWINQLAAEGGWVIVSGDPRISRNKIEKAAWRESGLTAFFLAKGCMNQKFWKQAAHLVKWWPDLILEAQKVPAGSGFEVPLKGKQLKQIYAPS